MWRRSKFDISAFTQLAFPTSVVPFSLTIGTFTSSASRIIVFKRTFVGKYFFVRSFFNPSSLARSLVDKICQSTVFATYSRFILLANLPELLVEPRNNKRQEEKTLSKIYISNSRFLAGFISRHHGCNWTLFNRFYLRYGLTKEEIVATRAANEIFLHSIKLIIYLILGLYSSSALWLGLTI